MPWARLEARIRPVYPTGTRIRPSYPPALPLRIQCVQLINNRSNPAMEDALHDGVEVQRFVGLTARGPRPDETTSLHCRRLLERHEVADGDGDGVSTRELRFLVYPCTVGRVRPGLKCRGRISLALRVGNTAATGAPAVTGTAQVG